MDLASVGIILSRQRTTKALIRLRRCTDCSVPLLFPQNRYSHDMAHLHLYRQHDCAQKKKHLFCSISGPYHPFLDTQTDMFRLESVFALSRITGLEPVRFQRTRLDWDIDNIYITTTMVGQTPQVMSKCLNKYICSDGHFSPHELDESNSHLRLIEPLNYF